MGLGAKLIDALVEFAKAEQCHDASVIVAVAEVATMVAGVGKVVNDDPRFAKVFALIGTRARREGDAIQGWVYFHDADLDPVAFVDGRR